MDVASLACFDLLVNPSGYSNPKFRSRWHKAIVTRKYLGNRSRYVDCIMLFGSLILTGVAMCTSIQVYTNILISHIPLSQCLLYENTSGVSDHFLTYCKNRVRQSQREFVFIVEDLASAADDGQFPVRVKQVCDALQRLHGQVEESAVLGLAGC
jgi:hypothetical protein